MPLSQHAQTFESPTNCLGYWTTRLAMNFMIVTSKQIIFLLNPSCNMLAGSN